MRCCLGSSSSAACSSWFRGTCSARRSPTTPTAGERTGPRRSSSRRPTRSNRSKPIWHAHRRRRRSWSVGSHRPRRQSTSVPPSRPLLDAARASARDGARPESRRAERRRHRAAGIDAARGGCADPHALAVLRAVVGQAPDRRAGTRVAAVRHRRAARRVVRAHEATASTSRSRSAAWWCSRMVTPIVVVGDLVANRGPLLLPPAADRPGRRRRSRCSSSGRCAHARRCEGDDWTAEDDVRITRFGRMLRRTHLDELPQVRQRPARRPLGRRATARAAAVRRRARRTRSRSTACATSCGPGLTGWAQVKYQYAGSEAETLEKLQYEFFYLRRQSLGLDLRIVGRTFRSVLMREGR